MSVKTPACPECGKPNHEHLLGKCIRCFMTARLLVRSLRQRKAEALEA